MSTNTPADYRASLREQLAVAGPAALDMLNGAAVLDVSTLMAAAQAAGLLDHVTVGEPALRTLRRQLVEAMRRSSLVEAALEQLDLSSTAYAMEGLELDDQQEILHQLVGLAGLAQVLPEALADRLEAPLVQAEGTALANPELVAPLASMAGWIADQLDLDDDHRVNLLLSAIEESALADEVVLDEPALARGMAAAGASFRRTRLSAWIDTFTQIGPWIADRLRQDEPLVAHCADDQPRSEANPVRVRIASMDDEELYLTSHSGRLFLEWDGPSERAPERVTLEPSGGDLQAEEQLFEEGTRLWSLGWPPSDVHVRCLVLHRGDERCEVSLAAQ